MDNKFTLYMGFKFLILQNGLEIFRDSSKEVLSQLAAMSLGFLYEYEYYSSYLIGKINVFKIKSI